MCWNTTVSLNTFLFSSFVLGLIIYNNAFTQYKIQELNNVWIYFFFASFIFMQLIEFFIWRNIHNTFYNNVFSTIATVLLIIQPIASLMILTNKKLRNVLLFSYLLLIIPYSVYNFSTKNIHTVMGKSGHLRWKYFETPPFLGIVWFFFVVFSLIYEKMYFGLAFGLIALIIAFINYNNDNTMWSMWCWSVNSVMIYYAAYLLIYLPFLERRDIC